MRSAIVLLVLLSACSSRDVAETAAKPVAAPLAAQESMLRELEQQKAQAHERRDLAERAVERDGGR